MQKIAFDVVLLPPKEITHKVIELNHSLKRDYTNARIYLNEENCLPHISLLMGTSFVKYFPEIESKLNYISENHESIDLEIISLEHEDLLAKDRILKIVGFSLRKSEALNQLYKNLVENIKIYLDNELTKEMMYNPNEIDEEDTPWMFSYIQNFIKNSSYDKFNPHITIGDGFFEQKLSFPIPFTTSRLALCHLGNYCTCRKILYEKELRKY